MALITKNLFSTKKLTWIFVLLLIISLSVFIKQWMELKNIQIFNRDIAEGKSPSMFINSLKPVTQQLIGSQLKKDIKKPIFFLQIFYR